MPDFITQSLESIRRVNRCRPEIKEAAEKLSHLTPEEYGMLIQELINSGEDETLGIVCNLCAANGIRLAPGLTAQVLKVIEPLIDFAPLYRFQDKEAIPPLLETALDEELSFERQIYAALIAVEMCKIHDMETEEALRVLRILEQSYSLTPMLGLLLGKAFDLLECDKEQLAKEHLLSQADIYSLLPKEKPPVVIGDGQTLRRSSPKIGRNAPCPCGSGKKYKKCCQKKDQEEVRHAASASSPTRLASPVNLDEEAQIIEQMRTYELKKLDPVTLSISQLYAAYQKADLFGLRELAFDMLLELEQRDADDFDQGHYIDLLDSTLETGNIELAKKIWHSVPPELLEPFELTKLQMDVIQHKDIIAKIENILKQEITHPETDFFDPPLLGLSYRWKKIFPALSIVCARAYILANLDRLQDVETALEAIHIARAEIGIDPWDDPMENIVEWSYEKEMEEIRETGQSERLKKLIINAEEAKKEARKKTKELQRKERELRELSVQLDKEKRKKIQTITVESPQPTAPPPTAEETGTIHKLRRRIEKLKGEVNAQQQIRRDLRQELRAEKEKSLKSPEAKAAVPKNHATEALLPPGTLKNILIPEYSAAFRRACETAPAPVAAKAVKAIGEFAAGGEEIWRHTRPIKKIAEYYRIKIDRNFRVLIHWEAGRKIEAVDLIPRKELETWIRNNS